MTSSSSQVLRGGAAKAGVVVAVGQPTAPSIIRGEAADRYPQCVHGVVVTPAPDHASGVERRLLAPVVGPVGLGPVGRARPPPPVAEQTLAARWAGPRWPEVPALGGVVWP